MGNLEEGQKDAIEGARPVSMAARRSFVPATVCAALHVTSAFVTRVGPEGGG